MRILRTTGSRSGLSAVSSHVHATGGGVGVLGFTAVHASYGKGVDDAVGLGVHRHSIGSDAALLFSGAAGTLGFFREAIGIELLIGNLSHTAHIIGHKA